MGAGNDVALLILGDGHQPVHGHDLFAGHSDVGGNLFIGDVAEGDVPHVGAHGCKLAKDARDQIRVSGREQFGQILHRDPQRFDGAEEIVRTFAVVPLFVQHIHNRGQRRHVPDHGHGAVLRMQRQCHPEGLGQRVHRRAPGCLQPVLRNALRPRRGKHLRVVGIHHQIQLGLVQVLLIRDRCRGRDPVGVVQENADVPQPAHAGLGAHGGQAHLDARIAEGALLSLSGAVVEVHLFVRAAGHALPPAAAAVLVHQHNPVLLALVDGAGRAGGHAGRIQAVLADPRQVEHEGGVEFQLHLLLRLAAHLFQHRIAELGMRRAPEIVVPVGGPLDLHVLAGNQGLGLRHRKIVAGRGVDEVLVVVGPGLVVVVQLRLDRAGEDAEELGQPAAGLQLQLPAAVQFPAALPLLLVLVTARIPLPGTGLHVVEPDVFGARPVGPGLFAGDGAGVAADALVQCHHHCCLGHDAHQYATSWERLRTTETMSRWLPVGPR